MTQRVVEPRNRSDEQAQVLSPHGFKNRRLCQTQHRPIRFLDHRRLQPVHISIVDPHPRALQPPTRPGPRASSLEGPRSETRLLSPVHTRTAPPILPLPRAVVATWTISRLCHNLSTRSLSKEGQTPTCPPTPLAGVDGLNVSRLTCRPADASRSDVRLVKIGHISLFRGPDYSPSPTLIYASCCKSFCYPLFPLLDLGRSHVIRFQLNSMYESKQAATMYLYLTVMPLRRIHPSHYAIYFVIVYTPRDDSIRFRFEIDFPSFFVILFIFQQTNHEHPCTTTNFRR